MRKRTKLIILNIAAYLFIVASIASNHLGFLEMFIPGMVLFGSNLYCLSRVMKDDE